MRKSAIIIQFLSGLLHALAICPGAAAPNWLQIAFPILMRFQMGQMHIEGGVGDLDLAGEPQN